MRKKRPWLWITVAGAATAAATFASAAGLGSGGSGAVLGQALDFAVQVRLDAGESLAAECVSAEVTLGERRLPSTLVRTVVESVGVEIASVRVLTAVAVDEPVVDVLLNVGCTSRLSRRFVVLADPPVTPSLAAPVYAAALPEAPASNDAGKAPLADSGGAAASQLAAPVTGAAAAPDRVAQRGLASSSAPTQGVARARGPARRVAAATPRQSAVRRKRAAAVAVADARPRLTVELAEPALRAEASAVDQAIQAVSQAASAAQTAASAASAAAERITALERTVEQLRAEAKGSRDFALQMRERLGRAEDSGRWWWPLLISVLLLAGLAAWLAWRLSAALHQRKTVWREASSTARPAEPTPSRQLTRPIPFVTSELASTRAPGEPSRSTPAWPTRAALDPWVSSLPATLAEDSQGPPTVPQAAAEPAMQRTEVLPPKAVSDEAAPRDVSIEELIDLEQQAEFFVVLGQDEAAVELLAEHLRDTGGGSPLPYLKLMEIYRRRGDRSDYERMRSRFNRRFNAYAPEWGVDLASGRTLEEYSGVVPRLQQVWSRPLDAMAELEALLFRKSRGELFELPAYRDVLFLYSLARDLLDREAADSGNVDVLLPLADGGEFSSTSPASYPGLEGDATVPRHEADDHPTAPLDFDLTAQADRPTSLFDSLEDLPPTPRRR